MKDVLQLEISLIDSSPKIWRRILVKKNTSFYKLHHIMQIAMGWQNYHLYEFNVDGYRIGEPDLEFDDFQENDKIIASSELTLEQVIDRTKLKFDYEYDFGDGWQHQILIEKFLPIDKNFNYPTCTEGNLNCPPEDCGGIFGFYNLLEILADKEHSEREEMLEWVGKNYDSESIDLIGINSILHLLDKYINDWEQRSDDRP